MLTSFPQYGLVARWPQDGQGWIHPADITTVTRLLPSERLLRRDAFDGSYYHYQYGQHRFRLRPCLWLPIGATDGIDVGDEVETLGVGMERELFVGQVVGMYYVRRKGRILYRLRRGDRVMPQLYLHDHLRVLTPKQNVRPSDFEHPTPTWNGAGERIGDI
ncbi:MAG: hypothetical protein AAF670_17290 [Planctomycetota bacterium]